MGFSLYKHLLFYDKMYLYGGYGMEFMVFVVIFLTVVKFLQDCRMFFQNRAEVMNRANIARFLEQKYQNI